MPGRRARSLAREIRFRRGRQAAGWALAVACAFGGPALGCASLGGAPVPSAPGSPAPPSNATTFQYVRLPLADNPVDPAGAAACFNGCRAARRSGQPAFLECLSGCPGFEQGNGTCGEDDVPPRAYCVDEPVRHDTNVAAVIGETIGTIIGVAVAIVVCVNDPNHCKNDDSN